MCVENVDSRDKQSWTAENEDRHNGDDMAVSGSLVGTSVFVCVEKKKGGMRTCTNTCACVLSVQSQIKMSGFPPLEKLMWLPRVPSVG